MVVVFTGVPEGEGEGGEEAGEEGDGSFGEQVVCAGDGGGERGGENLIDGGLCVLVVLDGGEVIPLGEAAEE